MERMFYGCSNLNSLNLSNFNTSSVTTMKEMFSSCIKLISLDLSNFNALKLKTIDCIIDNCNNLENINLKNAMINPNLISSQICSTFQPKLSICSENENWSKMFNLSDKQYVNCINNITFFNINENEHILKCYKKI